MKRAPNRACILAMLLLFGLSAVEASAQRRDRLIQSIYDSDRNGRLSAGEREEAFRNLRGQSFGRGGNRNWGPADYGTKLAPSDVRSYPATVPLYDPDTLRTIFIEFEDEDWEARMTAFYRTDIDLPAKVTVDGKVYRDVGVHFRGNSSFSSVPSGYKRSMDLSFDMVDANQKLYGHKKLNLLNGNEDPTFMRGVLALQIARDYYMAPKANFARVVINGESWGVYVNVEQFNGDMTKAWFESGKNDARWKVPGNANGLGALVYVGDSVGSYRNIYEIKSEDDPAQWEALVRMIRIVNQTPPDKLEAALKGVLDVDSVLRFLAVDNILVSGDGFWTKGGDYAIYRDHRGVFHLLQHDINEFFLASYGRGGTLTLDPLYNEGDSQKALAARLLAVPAYKAKYLKYVREISEKWLDWNRLGPVVQKYTALIREDVLRDPKKLFWYEEFVAGVAERPGLADARIPLRSFVERRRQFLDAYFGPAAR